MPANVNLKFGLCQERRPHNSIGTMLNSTCGCSKSLWNGKIDAFGRRRFGRHSGKWPFALCLKRAARLFSPNAPLDAFVRTKKNRNLPAPKCERENVGAGLSGRSKSVRWDWGTMSHRMLSVGPPPLCLSTFLRPSLAMTWWRESLESLRSKRVSRELGGFKAFLDNPHPPLLFYTLLDWKMLHFGTVRRKKKTSFF